MLNKLFFFALLPAFFLAACTHTPTDHKADRATASTGGKTRMRIQPQSCEAVYKAAIGSASRGDVFSAMQTCDKATEALCIARVQKNSDGVNSGNGDYIAATCELSAAYGANKAVNNDHATEGCENLYNTAIYSINRGEVDGATEVCKTAQEQSCSKMVESTSDGANTGDGRLISSVCELTASHGAFLEVKNSATKCGQYRKCLKTCDPEHSAHPGMCPATCQENYDPTKSCDADPCGQLQRCLKGCTSYKGDHPGMCAPTCQADFDPKKKCK